MPLQGFALSQRKTRTPVITKWNVFALSPRHAETRKHVVFCKSGGFSRFRPSTQLIQNAKTRKFNAENTTEFNLVCSPTICVFLQCRPPHEETRHYSMWQVFAFSLLNNVTDFRIVLFSRFCHQNKKTQNYKTEDFCVVAPKSKNLNTA